MDDAQTTALLGNCPSAATADVWLKYLSERGLGMFHCLQVRRQQRFKHLNLSVTPVLPDVKDVVTDETSPDVAGLHCPTVPVAHGNLHSWAPPLVLLPTDHPQAVVVEVDGTAGRTIQNCQEDRRNTRHAKYTDSPKLIDRRVEGMRQAMQGKGSYGHRLRRANVLPHQSNELYTESEFTKLVHATITNMWLWSKDNQGENTEVVPSQRSVSRVAGMITTEFGRRFKPQQRLDFVMKLVARRGYTINAEARAGKKDGPGDSTQDSNPAGKGMGGDNPEMRLGPKKYKPEVDDLIVEGKCPPLRRDADGIMMPLERVQDGIEGYIDHFGKRNGDDCLSEWELGFLCDTWAAGEDEAINRVPSTMPLQNQFSPQ